MAMQDSKSSYGNGLQDTHFNGLLDRGEISGETLNNPMASAGETFSSDTLPLQKSLSDAQRNRSAEQQ